jgi:uncharacterized protein involved in exopolysaccharide biosynthesis
MTVHVRRRLWYWRSVHYLSILRLRRGVVLGSAVLGVLISMIVTMTMTQVFSGRATVRDDGVDAQGVITNPPQDHSWETNSAIY